MGRRISEFRTIAEGIVERIYPLSRPSDVLSDVPSVLPVPAELRSGETLAGRLRRPDAADDLSFRSPLDRQNRRIARRRTFGRSSVVFGRRADRQRSRLIHAFFLGGVALFFSPMVATQIDGVAGRGRVSGGPWHGN